MKQYKVDSWNELLASVKLLRQDLGDPDILWFRGQSNANYLLLPSLFRFSNGGTKEQFLFMKFRQLSHRIFPRRTDDWETLFDMQHYGIPTRLLDWSENLGIATFFAATYNAKFNPGNDAAMYLLDPAALNNYSSITRIPIIPDDPVLEYRSIYWEKKPFAPVYPIAIEPLFLNDRIVAQRGMFTIHGDDITAIEILCDKAVKKIIMSEKAVHEALDFLEVANINELTVFPDIAGIADYVKRAAELTP